MAQDLETLIAARVADELTPIDTDELYDEMLREVHADALRGPFAHLDAAELLKEADPVAYRCGSVDHFDSLTRERQYEEIDEQLYDAREVQAIRDEIEAEDRAETDDDQHDADSER